MNPAPKIVDFPNTETKIQSETSLALARSDSGAPRLIVAYHYCGTDFGSTTCLTIDGSAVVPCRLSPTFPSQACRKVAEGLARARGVRTTKGLLGQQIQPRLRRTRPSAIGGADPDRWTVAYLSTAGLDASVSPVIDIEAREVSATAFGVATDLAPDSYPVCSTIQRYWGDYFDFVPFLGSTGSLKRVVAVTDSRGAACQRGEETAMPQHVRVTRW